MQEITHFEIAGLLVTVTAILAWINARFIRLPTTIGVMILALLFSLSLVVAHLFGVYLDDDAAALIEQIDFEEVLLDVMLAFLLFAGALHVNLNDLRSQGWVIATMATAGVLISTLAVGTLAWLILPLLGFELRFVEACLFGALISPTDPIAVLGLIKRAGAPKALEIKITGESLFNDGIGVVLFLALLGLAYPGLAHHSPHPAPAATQPHIQAGAELADHAPGPAAAEMALDIITLFGLEVFGGLAVGFIAGVIAYLLIRHIDDYSVEILVTLALVIGTYALCTRLHMSGPLAVVIAGLLIGNKGRLTGMSDNTREHVDKFWELNDELLNALLFVLIGLEVLILDFTGKALIAGAIMIPVVLGARALAVYGGTWGLHLSRLRREFTPGARLVLTWAGLRGGISVALALAIPTTLAGGASNSARDIILAITYAVVAFSIIVQGLTVPAVIRAVVRSEPELADAPIQEPAAT